MKPLYIVMDTKDGALLTAQRSRVMPALYQHARVAEYARKVRCRFKLDSTIVCEAQITVGKPVEFND